MYLTILTLHIIGALLFFCASGATFFSYVKPYAVETYRALAQGISALLLGEVVSGSLLAILPHHPLNYVNLCAFIALYTLIALATFYVLKKRLKEHHEPLPSLVYTFSLAGVASLLSAFIS